MVFWRLSLVGEAVIRDYSETLCPDALLDPVRTVIPGVISVYSYITNDPKT